MDTFRTIVACAIAGLAVLGAVFGGWFFIALAIWAVVTAEVITFTLVLGACLAIALRGLIGLVIFVAAMFVAALIYPGEIF